MSDHPELRGMIIRTLLLPEVQNIHFHCGSRTVDSSCFRGVVDRLIKKKIRIGVRARQLRRERSEAQYVSDHHRFLFRKSSYGTNLFEKGTIVHKSVHAGFDVTGHGDKYLQIDDEPSAYLAESFFLLNSGVSFDEVDADNEGFLSAQLAFTIAMNMRSSKDFSVSRDDLGFLRNGVSRETINIDHDDPRIGTDKDEYSGIAP